jgi:hypothetical protein
MVREQLGFALNRLNRRDEAEATLRATSTEHGLGRVYKDRWEEAKAGRQVEARGWASQGDRNLFGRIHAHSTMYFQLQL